MNQIMIARHNYKCSQIKHNKWNEQLEIYIYNNNRCYNNKNYIDNKTMIYWITNVLVITLLVITPPKTTHIGTYWIMELNTQCNNWQNTNTYIIIGKKLKLT